MEVAKGLPAARGGRWLIDDIQCKETLGTTNAMTWRNSGSGVVSWKVKQDEQAKRIKSDKVAVYDDDDGGSDPVIDYRVP
jgi:hypothetical protein